MGAEIEPLDPLASAQRTVSLNPVMHHRVPPQHHSLDFKRRHRSNLAVADPRHQRHGKHRLRPISHQPLLFFIVTERRVVVGVAIQARQRLLRKPGEAAARNVSERVARRTERSQGGSDALDRTGS
jgi:hypothetical protein